ncbi:hypothetical protein J132_10389 [Termitomyces sp. J132]|nr:hypothetical protein J132_10389 [Termitomyces sp. J132]
MLTMHASGWSLVAGYWQWNLTEVVAAKSVGCIKNLVGCLFLTANFLSMNNAKQAETTLALKATAEALEKVTSLLGTLAPNSVSPPPTSLSAGPLTWAAIAKAVPPHHTLAVFDPQALL